MRTSPEVAPRASGPGDELEAFRRRRRSVFYPKTDTPLDDDRLRSLRHEGAGPVDPDLVSEACRRTLGEEPLAVRALADQGTFHRLFRVVLPGERAVIVRVNALGETVRDFPLLTDRWAMGRLRSAGLPSLRVHAVDLSRRSVPFDYEILEEARGVSLRAHDHDEAEIRPRLRELGRLVARIHAIGVPGFGWIDPGPLLAGGEEAIGLFDTWREYVLLNLPGHVAACVAIGAIGRDEARRINAAFAAADGLLDGVEPRLLHGDLGNHNVFVEGPAITALIDWEDCLAGDPAFDVAFWGTFHPDARREAFLDGYRSEGSLPPDFERRYWLYYLRIALSKTVHRHRFGYADRPGRPPASERIRRALARAEASS
jgi:aminoglycoside phosphotransferase (APT) family kinase protein